MPAYTCHLCSQPLDPEAKGVARRVVGWIRNGSNTVTDASPATAYAHSICLETKRRGIDPAAPTLF